MDKASILEFVMPYYESRDIMHNMWHVELVHKMVQKILLSGHYAVDEESLLLATYFHGVIYKDETAIIEWLKNHGYPDESVGKIVQIAWESQRREEPDSIEGKILHDAHVLEGGKTYLVVKTLITGSVRGQSLKDTLSYMERNVLDKNKCYLPETIPLCEEMNRFARDFYEELQKGIQ